MFSSAAPSPSSGMVFGRAVCVAIGLEFLVRNEAVVLQRSLLSFRQERSLQVLVTEGCGVLIQDTPLGKRLMCNGIGKVTAGRWRIEHVIRIVSAMRLHLKAGVLDAEGHKPSRMCDVGTYGPSTPGSGALGE